MIKKTIFVFNGVILNEDGNILIANRSEKELPSADQKWGLPGGKIEFGETPDQAVVREAMEETGCEVEIIGMIPITYTNIWRYSDKEQHTVVFGYYGRLIKVLENEIYDKKVNQIKWISPKDITSYDFLPGVLEMIEYVIRNHLGK